MTPQTLSTSRLEERFVSAFALQDGHTLNGSNARIQSLRREAIDQVARIGFPTRKTEAWKYTQIEKLLRHDFQLLLKPAGTAPSPEEVVSYLFPELDSYVLVLLNGRVLLDASTLDGLPSGVAVSGLAHAAEWVPAVVNQHYGMYARHGSEVFAALNTAFTQDGAFVYVPKGVVLEKPLLVLNITDTPEDAIVQPRNLVVLEDGAVAQVIERNVSRTAARTLTNAVTEVVVGQDANLAIYKLQEDHTAGSRIDTIYTHQAARSVVNFVTVTTGGEVVRNNLNVNIDGDHAEAHLYGLYLGRGEMHVDNHTFIEHARPACQSNELYKAILDDSSTGVFNGKVYVHRAGQQTNAYQSSKSVVLTERAQMFSKPELEIYADDVKCSHGATTGQLDREGMFYLMARGIPEKRARAMMLLAFARDVIDHVTIEPIHAYLSHIAEEHYHV